MADFDPQKMLSLKLVTLSKSDQNWLLGKIPAQFRDKLLGHMTAAKKFNVRDLDQLQQQLLLDSNASQVAEDVEQSPCLSEMQAHLQNIVQGRVEVAPKAADFVKKRIG